jgi:hypothetical protein
LFAGQTDPPALLGLQGIVPERLLDSAEDSAGQNFVYRPADQVLVAGPAGQRSGETLGRLIFQGIVGVAAVLGCPALLLALDFRPHQAFENLRTTRQGCFLPALETQRFRGHVLLAVAAVCGALLWLMHRREVSIHRGCDTPLPLVRSPVL